jgi:drug/metabolite transporter (DMT)-like permease
MVNKDYLGSASAFTSAFLMGTLGLFVRNVSSNAQIITFSRLFLGFLFLTLLLLITGRFKEIRMKLSMPIVLSGIFTSISILFYIESIKYTTLATAVILLYLGPIIGTVLAYFFLKERVKPLNVVLIIIAFSGTAFLLEFNFSFDLSKFGYIFGIASAITYSFYFIANRKIDKDIPLIGRSFYQFFFGTIAILPFLFFGKTGFIMHDIPYLISIGFIHGFLALTLLTLALKNLEVVKCGTILYVEPITATIFGWLLFSEKISILQLIGGIMILGSGLMQIGYSIKDTVKHAEINKPLR